MHHLNLTIEERIVNAQVWVNRRNGYSIKELHINVTKIARLKHEMGYRDDTYIVGPSANIQILPK